MWRELGKKAPVLIVALLLQACKLVSEVPNSGQVNYQDGSIFCGAGDSCSLDINDSFFDETFMAEPAPGFAFAMWNRDSICARTDRACRISTRNFDKNETLQRLLDSSQKGFLRPEFSPLLEAVPCNDTSVPESLKSLIFFDPFLSFFRFDDCGFSTAGPNALYAGLSFAEIGTGQLPFDNGIGGWLGPGDLILMLQKTDFSRQFVVAGGDAIVLYIDADNDPDTGRPSHAVLGADYRAWVSDCSFLGDSEFGTITVERRQGFLEYWSVTDRRWKPVPDNDFQFKASGVAQSSDDDWDVFFFTGFGENGIGVPGNVAVRVETLGNNCTLPQNRPMKFFAGVVGQS